MAIRTGVYSWLTHVSSCGERGSVFVHTLEEDKGKSESIDGHHFFPLLQGMFGLAGGAVEPEDQSHESAVIREIHEELGLNISQDQISNGLPSFTVHQLRKGKLINFTVVGYNTVLKDDQYEALVSNHHAQFVTNDNLLGFLQENRTRFRRYVHYAGMIIALQRNRFSL